MVPWISEAMLALAVPLLPPLWIEFSGPLLLAYGLSHRRMATTRKRRKWKLRLWPRKAKRKTVRKAAKPPRSTPKLAVVK